MKGETATTTPKTSGLAIASLVLGILGLLGFLLSIPGLILGIVGLKRIRRSGGELTGEGLAVAGISISAVFLVIVAMLLPAFLGAKERARSIKCISNLKQIALGCKIYAMDHSDFYPDKLSNLYPNYLNALYVFACPSTKDKISSADDIDEDTSYIYVSGHTKSDPPDELIAYDKAGNHDEHGDRQKGRLVLYMDGHVKWKQNNTHE